MSDTITPIEIAQASTEKQNYRRIQSLLMEPRAVLALIEDRDGPNDEELVGYATYELAACAARRLLDDLSEEVDRMGRETREVQS